MRRRVSIDAELDVIPVMSLIVHLIPMILLSVSFVKVAQLPSDEPVLPSEESASVSAYAEQQERVVSVRITSEGFVVGGGTREPRIPCSAACTADTYDYVGLLRALVDAKRLHPTETRVVIAPMPEVTYEVVVRVMAAARGEEGRLFPSPLLAAP
jgi:biopolymer transport protein ExbD